MPTPEEIRACADAILSKYDDAPVRSFVFTLAEPDARECLPRGPLLRTRVVAREDRPRAERCSRRRAIFGATFEAITPLNAER